jgi:hypothetical protein
MKEKMKQTTLISEMERDIIELQEKYQKMKSADGTNSSKSDNEGLYNENGNILERMTAASSEHEDFGENTPSSR